MEAFDTCLVRTRIQLKANWIGNVATTNVASKIFHFRTDFLSLLEVPVHNATLSVPVEIIGK